MSLPVDEVILEDMMTEDNLELTIPESFNEAMDNILYISNEGNSIEDEDGGLLFPPEMKDFNEYYDEEK